MAKTYRVNFTVRLSNATVSALLRVGVPIGNMTLLTVRGRKSGLPRTTPVYLGERDGRRWLVSTFGELTLSRLKGGDAQATLGPMAHVNA